MMTITDSPGVDAGGATSSIPDEKAVVTERTNEFVDREARPACFGTTIQEILFVLTATMTIAMGSFGGGSLTVITSFVGRDLGMTTAEITWINSASALSGGSFLLFFGKVADLFGRKSLVIGSLFFYAVFALVAGFARDPVTLDVLTGVMGLFTASGVPAAQGLLGVIYEKPSRRKNIAMACFSAGNPLGFVFGTIFSGIVTDIFNWRASFWLLAIVYLAFSIIAVFTLPKDSTPKEPFTWQTIKRFDFLGTALTIAGIGMFSAALTCEGTAPQGWKTGYILALLIVGALLMVAFVFWENHYAYPLVPMGIWKDRNFSLVMAVIVLGFMVFPPIEFFISLFFQNVWHWTSLMTAVHLLPMAVMGIIVNIFAGLALHRMSNKIMMIMGASAYTVSFLLFALNRQSDSYWAFCFVALCLAVVGADLEFNVANMYVMSSLPPSQQSIAGSIFQTVTKLCQSIGYGIATAVFNSVARNPSMGGYYRNDVATQPYAAVCWFAAASSALSIVVACFLTLGTQGGVKEEADEEHKERFVAVDDHDL
ncbi:hypothetical protein MBLNU459_g3875t1 [Dothideomycetes sp. NU459]